ncbi:MAG: LysM peptidoglycan-binding domain-containing protein [Cyanobacteria bacterium]|nr:LysM peptidoglycan-binding domain-containing protein [Cyanobacteriota bacterium]
MRRSLVALALALVLPLPVMAGQITVKEGETLSEIADRYGMSTNQLMKLNGLSNADHVESGQTLSVPGRNGTSSGSVSGSGRVTVQDGETLSEIAERQGMSVQQLMKLNGLSNADHVESGQTLLVSGRSKSPTTASGFRRGANEHVVRSGESLSVIADGYGIGLSKLIAVNGISDPDHVEAGTRLKLKGNPPVLKPASSTPAASQAAVAKPVATAPVKSTAAQAPTIATAPARAATTTASAAVPVIQSRPIASATPITATPLSSRSTRLTAAAPTTATATTIASASKSQPSLSSGQAFNATTTGATGGATSPASTPAVRPVSANNVTRTVSSTKPVATVATAPRTATTARTAASGKPDWRPYGPLQVDWTGWQPMGGSMVAPTLNAQGQSLYLAINCGARKLNATTQTGDWKTWDNPSSDFELQLVNDYCRSRS